MLETTNPQALTEIALPQYVPCAICGTADTVPLFRPKTSCGLIVQCRQCGLVYVNPRESAPWLSQVNVAHRRDLVKAREVWEQEWFQRYIEESPWKCRNFAHALHKLERLGIQSSSSPKVLDFGCSIGLFLQIAEDAGWTAYGIEPDTPAALYAQEVLGLDGVMNCTLQEAGLPDGYFDAVVSFQVFEHLPDPTQELKEITRVLKQDGLLALEVPSIDNIWYRLLRGRHRHFATEQHLYFYTPRTVSLLVERAGYEVLDITFPTRSLSIAHVLKHHVALYSERVAFFLVKLGERLNVLDKTLSMNMRDILCLYARKTSC